MTIKIISIQNMAQIVGTQNKADKKKKNAKCVITAKLHSIHVYLPVINLFPWDLTLEQLASKLY